MIRDAQSVDHPYPGELFSGSCLCISPPLFYEDLHILSQFAFEHHLLARFRMNEPEGFRLQGMARTYFEAVVDELFVFGEYRPFDDAVASVDVVVEKGMSDMLHMYADLVCAARLKPAFHKGHIA